MRFEPCSQWRCRPRDLKSAKLDAVHPANTSASDALAWQWSLRHQRKPALAAIAEHVNYRQAGPRIQASVGLVWAVQDGAEPWRLVISRTPLNRAEPYGDALTHPGGHCETWEAWRRLGPAALARRGLPPLIAWHEYEHFPRGRVVFHTTPGRFTLYADRRLRTSALLPRILRAFALDPARCAIRADPHYRTVVL